MTAVIREAVWIVLGREPSADELASLEAHQRAGGDALVLRHLLASPEFHLIFSGWRDDIGIGKDPPTHEVGPSFARVERSLHPSGLRPAARS